MGGGGGGDFRPIGDPEELKELEEKAKKELQEGGKRNTFLSFDNDDRDEVNLLRGQAKNDKSDIEFIDWSVKDPIDSDKAKYIKLKISQRIKQCSLTVVYVSDTTHKSKWVNWEINRSLELGKEVVATHKGDTAPRKLPDAIKENKIKVVPWSELGKEL